MVFERYVEIGRVAYVSFGSYAGKLVAIVDVIDKNRALVEVQSQDKLVPRQQAMEFKRLQLTDYTIKVPHSARQKFVRRAWEKAQVDEKWSESSWKKKIEARENRADMLDIHRFEVTKTKREMKKELRPELRKLQEEAAAKN